MKIKKIVAAVTALVLVGGAYPFAAGNSINVNRVFAAEENADENSVRFECEKTILRQGEPVRIVAENLNIDNCTYSGENITREEVISEPDRCVFAFNAGEEGTVVFRISYIENELERTQEFRFDVTDEYYEDENSVRFDCEKTILKQGEPVRIVAENLNIDNCTYSGENITREEVISEPDGCIFAFNAGEAGTAVFRISYIENELERTQEFRFDVTDEVYEEETENVEVPALMGDANCDGNIDMGDVVLIMQALANPQKYGLNGSSDKHITEHGLINCDVDKSAAGMTNNDALTIQKFLLGIIDKLS